MSTTVTHLADPTDARFTDAQREQLEAFEGAPAAPETFDPIAALRRVSAVVGELDAARAKSSEVTARLAYREAADALRAALAPQAGEAAPCWCMTCESAVREAQAASGDWLGSLQRRFIVCPLCGNKRCPRATHHDRPCTGSNEVGQPGSAWEHVK